MLFDYDHPKDNSPIDDTEIRQVLLYYSKPESEEFKKLCKKAIVEFYGTAAPKDGNISDVLLHFLRQKYGENNSQKTDDRQASRATQNDLFGG